MSKTHALLALATTLLAFGAAKGIIVPDDLPLLQAIIAAASVAFAAFFIHPKVPDEK